MSFLTHVSLCRKPRFFGGSHQTIISTWQKIKPQFSVLASMVKKCAKPPVLGTFITMELPIKMASLRWVIQPQGPQPLETSPPPLRGELSERQESEWHRFHWRGSWKVPDSSSPGKAAGFDGKSTTEHQRVVYAFILFNPVALIKKESGVLLIWIFLLCSSVEALFHATHSQSVSNAYSYSSSSSSNNSSNNSNNNSHNNSNNNSNTNSSNNNHNHNQQPTTNNNNNNKIKRSATATP